MYIESFGHYRSVDVSIMLAKNYIETKDDPEQNIPFTILMPHLGKSNLI